MWQLPSTFNQYTEGNEGHEVESRQKYDGQKNMRDEDNYANAVLRIAAQMKYGTKDEPIENVNEDIQSRDASQSNSFNPFEVDERQCMILSVN